MILRELIKKYSNKSSNYILYTVRFDSPIGVLVAAANDGFLLLLMCEDSKNIEKRFQVFADQLHCTFVEEKNKILYKLDQELKEYFEGTLTKFTVPVKMAGSDFQKEVWDKLINISYGFTQSYGDMAKGMGRPASHSRAVGAACGANAHLIVVPCHRLVASNSKGGFSCGTDRKDWLLEHENKFKK